MLHKTKGHGQLAPSTIEEMTNSGFILREFQHRVGNTLTILKVSFQLDFAGISDPELKEKFRLHEQRIHDLAELHHFFSREIGSSAIIVTQYFHSLCALLNRSILAPLALQCETSIGEGVLDGSTCEWLGLIVAELVMNSAKHAFSDYSDGRVRVEVRAVDAVSWLCSVADNGCGIRAAMGGTGSQIVSTLVQMLNGQMSMKTSPEGTVVTVLFPAPRFEYHAPDSGISEVTN